MTVSETYTITAALPYANGFLHIGHFAGNFLGADITARFRRQKGDEVAFITGSDEGGAAITLQAHKEGISPQELVDRYHHLNEKSLRALGISFDIFSRTSSPHHHKVAQDFFQRLYEQQCLEVKDSEQYYDSTAQTFLADRYVSGTCPHCASPQAHADQCEACGRSLDALDLLDPRSTVSGSPPERRTTRHWYLPLARYQRWLQRWIESHDTWKANVRGQCLSWLREGLKARAITRDLQWGIPVPLEEASGKVLYVWFEAPVGYISATQSWAAQQGKSWEKFWKEPQTKLIHFLGKDNIVFHCLIFPAMLHAHGDYILPTQVAANEFMTLEGRKISTSRNHAVWLHDYLERFPGKEDVLRYVLCANMPETKDSDFTWQDFLHRNNSELVAILGNFVHRTLVLIHKYFGGRVPAATPDTPLERSARQQLEQAVRGIGESLEAFSFRKGLSHWMELARIGNKYLATAAPWHLYQEAPARAGGILYFAVQIVAHIMNLGAPFLPFTTQKLSALLSLPCYAWPESYQDEALKEGHPIAKPRLLFDKIEELPHLT